MVVEVRSEQAVFCGKLVVDSGGHVVLRHHLFSRDEEFSRVPRDWAIGQWIECINETANRGIDRYLPSYKVPIACVGGRNEINRSRRQGLPKAFVITKYERTVLADRTSYRPAKLVAFERWGRA